MQGVGVVGFGLVAARCGLLLRRGQANPDRNAAALCRESEEWWPALWTFA
jgi:hypothetical protein